MPTNTPAFWEKLRAANFDSVTREEFFAEIGPRDVTPTIVSEWPYIQQWYDQRSQIVVGYTNSELPKLYYINRAALARVPKLQ